MNLLQNYCMQPRNGDGQVLFHYWMICDNIFLLVFTKFIKYFMFTSLKPIIGENGEFKKKDLKDYIKTFDANQIFRKNNKKDYKVVKELNDEDY